MAIEYFVGKPTPKQGAHHESINKLWELKWKKRAALGIYPFMEGELDDLSEVFKLFSEDDMKPPYDFETYAKRFFPVAENLEQLAREAENNGNTKKAADLWLRAACVYRTARQPCPQSPSQKLAWDRNKVAFYNGGKYLEEPISEQLIPHTHAKSGSSEENKFIPVTVRIPTKASATSFPTIILIFGLDGYRTEHINSSNYHMAAGWASVAVEIPGTGDCPADPNDPTSPDRLWSSLIDWVESQKWAQKNKIVAWGVSCGGYYAMRIAHTHRDRLAGVVAQGGGCHHMFDPEWLEVASHMEYPFDLTHVLALKFGYSDVEEMKKDSKRRFSLVENRILDMPSTRLLLINGMLDELFPIEDSLLILQHGSIKDARFFPDLKHMGEPVARKFIMEWIEKLFNSIL